MLERPIWHRSLDRSHFLWKRDRIKNLSFDRFFFQSTFWQIFFQSTFWQIFFPIYLLTDFFSNLYFDRFFSNLSFDRFFSHLSFDRFFSNLSFDRFFFQSTFWQIFSNLSFDRFFFQSIFWQTFFNLCFDRFFFPIYLLTDFFPRLLYYFAHNLKIKNCLEFEKSFRDSSHLRRFFDILRQLSIFIENSKYFLPLPHFFSHHNVRLYFSLVFQEPYNL